MSLLMNFNFLRSWFTVSLLLILGARYGLTSSAEIMGAPYDTDMLAYLALHGIWSYPLDPMRPPFFLMVAHAIMKTGIPWRIFLELAFLAAAFAVAKTTCRLAGQLSAIPVTIAYLFNPYAIRSFDEFQREPLLLVLYSVFLLTWVWLVILREQRSATYMSVLYGIAGTSLILTREGEELFVIFAFIVGSATLPLVERRISGCWPKSAQLKRWIRVAFVIPTIIVGCGVLANREAQGAHWGVYNLRGQLALYQDLLTQIHRIRVEDSVRFAPATRKSFIAAAELSPTFADFVQPILSGSSSTDAERSVAIMREHSISFVGRPEIDSSRTIWALVAALNEKYRADNGAKLKALTKATKEIDDALSRRPELAHWIRIPYPFDPNWENWAGQWPSAMLHSFRMLLAPTEAEAGPILREDWNPRVFDAALNRRTALLYQEHGGRAALRDEIVRNGPWLLGFIIAFGIIVGAIDRRSFDAVVVYSAATGVVALLAFRVLVYSAMLASVAPVNRYQVFLSPLCAALSVFAATMIPRLTRNMMRRHQSNGT